MRECAGTSPAASFRQGDDSITRFMAEQARARRLDLQQVSDSVAMQRREREQLREQRRRRKAALAHLDSSRRALRRLEAERCASRTGADGNMSANGPSAAAGVDTAAAVSGDEAIPFVQLSLWFCAAF